MLYNYFKLSRDRERRLEIARWAFAHHRVGLPIPHGFTVAELIDCLVKEDPKLEVPLDSDLKHRTPLQKAREQVESQPIPQTLVKLSNGN
ncbi:MAG: hypothetical protein UX80_C0018G0006 [Candidatus Amesbacteria bacterium GW2011_GWA2_47_11b]|uniref:Uncharacterized protein n=2 Tax=Candidatus Amesiibacteriota TaxID=1752730 RepID=A0A0G1SDF8_9BACT|nr:MAG: hypothetical protein UX42_C0018G0004 [Microgenomates group bacterium GW2011_GWC1_46_20]KKU57352.1 MAG: hypothetical protein UX80_C0018G0006 [Candidatus Amesbacteria bacterium GW2011_GWA2_47_11b]KKU67432.1 MAG: hypothetical protein UX92_C0031G0006 [Candidatus Amesbacteria bacterium GW2011_GWA1_47_20]